MSNSRFSFAKNNMNAAIAMSKNNYGQTLLNAEKLEIEDDGGTAELAPHIDSSGELVHNTSISDSPTLKRFLENLAKNPPSVVSMANALERAQEPSQEPSIESGDVQISNINTFAREFENEGVFEQSQTRKQRVFASSPTPPDTNTPQTIAKFCTECGYGFPEVEKFCPRCGCKRTYITSA